jgi:hypothetical protein
MANRAIRFPNSFSPNKKLSLFQRQISPCLERFVLERSLKMYGQFKEIIDNSYEPEEILACENWADELMKDVDAYSASGLESEDEEFSVKVEDENDCPWKARHSIFDWDEEDMEWEE